MIGFESNGLSRCYPIAVDTCRIFKDKVKEAIEDPLNKAILKVISPVIYGSVFEIIYRNNPAAISIVILLSGTLGSWGGWRMVQSAQLAIENANRGRGVQQPSLRQMFANQVNPQ